MILDVTSCGVASLIHDDGSSRIRNRELLLGSDCHSGTWFRVPETEELNLFSNFIKLALSWFILNNLSHYSNLGIWIVLGNF